MSGSKRQTATPEEPDVPTGGASRSAAAAGGSSPVVNFFQFILELIRRPSTEFWRFCGLLVLLFLMMLVIAAMLIYALDPEARTWLRIVAGAVGGTGLLSGLKLGVSLLLRRRRRRNTASENTAGDQTGAKQR